MVVPSQSWSSNSERSFKVSVAIYQLTCLNIAEDCSVQTLILQKTLMSGTFFSATRLCFAVSFRIFVCKSVVYSWSFKRFVVIDCKFSLYPNALTPRGVTPYSHALKFVADSCGHWMHHILFMCLAGWHGTGASNKTFHFISDIHQVRKGAEDRDLHQK